MLLIHKCGWICKKGLSYMYIIMCVCLHLIFKPGVLQLFNWLASFLKLPLSAMSVCVCLCACVCVCVFPPLRLLVSSGMIWTPYDRLNKFYSFYVVGIISRCGLSIDAYCGNQPSKRKLALYKPSIHFNNGCI